VIVCNTRILNAPRTGVGRYTTELLKRMPAMRTVRPPALLKTFVGHAWEQVVLPFHARGNLLWSPAGTGPIGVRNQVITVHDIAPLEYPEGYSPAFRQWYEFLWRRALPRVRAIITVSEFNKRRLIERLGLAPDAIHVTHLGVDHSYFYPRGADEIDAVRRKHGLPEKFVLFVGSLSARKNIRRLIEAWRETRDPDACLVLAGGFGSIGLAGGELPDLPPRTKVIGRVDDDDLPALFTAATLFAYPSVYEGFGLPPLEAMACGTPCLVSNVTSIPEVAGAAARQVDPEDVPGLARALDELLGDASLLARMREAGLNHVKRFTWDATALRTNEILRRFTDESDHALAFHRAS
jgi:glycosyltransferase involved in cell wall biosynthesis